MQGRIQLAGCASGVAKRGTIRPLAQTHRFASDAKTLATLLQSVRVIEDVRGAAKQKSAANVGLIQVKSGEVNTEKLEEELKNLIDRNWIWRVRKLTDQEYLATFPSKLLLDTFSRSKSVDLTLYNISVTISHLTIDPRACSVLQTGWVQISNVPDSARNLEAISLIAELAGEVVVVDEVSLIKDGPVRVKLRARDVSKTKGFVEIFVEGVGYEVKFVPEGATQGPKIIPPPQDKPDDDDYNEDDDEADDLSDYEGEIRRRLEEPLAPRRSSGSRKEKSAPNPQGKSVRGEKQSILDGHQLEKTQGREEVLEISPLAAYNPKTEALVILAADQELLSQESNKSAMENSDKKVKELNIPPNHSLVHTEDGGHRFLAQEKWPALNLNQHDDTLGNDGGVGSIGDSMLEFQESLGGGEVVESQPYPEEVPGILIHQQQEA